MRAEKLRRALELKSNSSKLTTSARTSPATPPTSCSSISNTVGNNCSFDSVTESHGKLSAPRSGYKYSSSASTNINLQSNVTTPVLSENTPFQDDVTSDSNKDIAPQAKESDHSKLKSSGDIYYTQYGNNKLNKDTCASTLSEASSLSQIQYNSSKLPEDFFDESTSSDTLTERGLKEEFSESCKEDIGNYYREGVVSYEIIEPGLTDDVSDATGGANLFHITEESSSCGADTTTAVIGKTSGVTKKIEMLKSGGDTGSYERILSPKISPSKNVHSVNDISSFSEELSEKSLLKSDYNVKKGALLSEKVKEAKSMKRLNASNFSEEPPSNNFFTTKASSSKNLNEAGTSKIPKGFFDDEELDAKARGLEAPSKIRKKIIEGDIKQFKSYIEKKDRDTENRQELQDSGSFLKHLNDLETQQQLLTRGVENFKKRWRAIQSFPSTKGKHTINDDLNEGRVKSENEYNASLSASKLFFNGSDNAGSENKLHINSNAESKELTYESKTTAEEAESDSESYDLSDPLSNILDWKSKSLI